MNKCIITILIIFFSGFSCRTSQVQRVDPPVQNGRYLGQKPPGDKVELFANIVFSKFEHLHSCPVFSPDGNEMFWAVASNDCRAWYMEKDSSGQWSSPKKALFLHNGNADSPIFSPDGQKIFYLSDHPTDIVKARNENIWYVQRTRDGWSEPVLLGPEVNSYTTHWQVSIANNGNIYFSGTKTNVDDKNIIMAQFVNGEYVNAADLSEKINTTYNEDNPFIDPDEKYLIFSRNSGGLKDLFVSFKKSDGTWKKAKKMGRRINSGGHDLCANVTRDGKYLFFMSPRIGPSEIYWIDAKVIEKER
ncbi:MAG: hypothetical protein GY863_10580 [bacterium]|nr:hypothetical protein [bacterium]